MIELNERLLADAGGWQAMKEARALCDMDRVLDAAWDAPMLQGRVRSGETEYRAGLRVLSKSNIENLCSCRDSRQRGMICAHSLAVGLAVLKPRPAAPAPAPATTTERPQLEKGATLIFADDGEALEHLVADQLAQVLPRALLRQPIVQSVNTPERRAS